MSDLECEYYDEYSDHCPSDEEVKYLKCAYAQHSQNMSQDAVPAISSQDEKAMTFTQFLEAVEAYNAQGGLTIDPPFEPQPEYSPPAPLLPPEPTQARTQMPESDNEVEVIESPPVLQKVRKPKTLQLYEDSSDDETLYDLSEPESSPCQAETRTKRSKKKGGPSMRPHPDDDREVRGFVITIFDEPGETTLLDKVKNIPWDYCVIGQEIGGLTHRQHCHVYGYFRNTRCFASIRAIVYPMWIEPAKTVEQAIEYATKDHNIIYEVGTRPCTKAQKGRKGGRMEQERWARALAASEAGNYEAIEPQIRFLHMDKAEKHRERFLAKSYPGRVLTKHLWIWGESGTGKSRHVWDTYDNPPGSLFVKPCNKWWPLYKNEKYVLLDDFDKRHDVLVHYLKIWADAYPFQAEVKGSFQKIRPELIIITSNYHPKDIWNEPSDLEPILRRFDVKEFKKLKAHDDT